MINQEASYPFTRYVYENNIIADCPMRLVDVGASGGIDLKWHVLGDHLEAYGFDPLVNECQRLNTESNTDKIQYIAAFVTGPKGADSNDIADMDGLFDWERLSAYHAIKALETQPEMRYNSYQDIIYADQQITLDSFFHKKPYIDFLKIDTDGHDINVLQGATKLLQKGHVLGICIECQFHGPVDSNSNTFANIDRFLRRHGFSLFDMEIHRYSRMALPGRFLLSIPAQTDTGQIQWADAIYFRDLADKNYTKRNNYKISSYNIIKLACLFELYGLNDCAIELLNVYDERIEFDIDMDHAKQLLVPPIDGHRATIQDYTIRYQKSIEEMRFLMEGDLHNINLERAREKQLLKQKKVLFFGAGGRLIQNLQTLLNIFSQTEEFAIADNDKNKWGTFIEGIEVVPPEHIKSFNPSAIVIVSIYGPEIIRQIIDLKLQHDLDFKIFSY